MSMIRSVFPAVITSDGVGEDEVMIRMSTGIRARDGHILEPGGAVLDNYRANPIMLWSHDINEPVGTSSEITRQSDCITSRVKFAPLGISPVADKTRGLVKADIVRGVSIGFEIIEGEPIDPSRPRAGLRVSKWELLECSFCSVPVDVGAVVTQRAEGANPEEKPGMPDVTDRALAALRIRMLVDAPKITQRGLGTCARLAWMLDEFGWLHDSSKWEEEIEGDGSQVPAMLGEALKQLGAALVAMTTEEVAEMLSGKGIEVEIDDDDEVDDMPAGERAYVRSAPTPLRRAWRRHIAGLRLRAGKALNAANTKKLGDAADHQEKAIDAGATSADNQQKVGTAHDAAADAHARAETAHDKLGTALADAKAKPDEAAGHIDAALKQHRALGRNLDAVGDAHQTLGLAHGDATDSVGASTRSMRAAMRCMRSVLDDTDTTEIQGSEGVEDVDADRALTHDYRRRQLAALELSPAE